MSNARAIKMAAAGAVAVGGALWFSPPQPVLDWLQQGEPVATKEPAGSETGTEAPTEVALAINPLSGLAADAFKETLQRPLFNPGRAGRPKDPEPEPKPEPVVTDEPPADDGVNAADLSLLAVAGSQDDLVAMVRWTKTNQVYRLKRGQFLSDLELVKVDLRGATLRKDDKVIDLALFSKAAGAATGIQPVAEDVPPDGAVAEDGADTEAAAQDAADAADTADDADAAGDSSDEEFENEADTGSDTEE